MAKLGLSTYARGRLRALTRQHATYDAELLMKLTGYPLFAVREFIQELVDKDAAKDRERREREQKREAARAEARRQREVEQALVEPSEMPQFVRDCQERTGMKAIFVQKVGNLSEWLLLSPTDVPIVRIAGASDLLQGVQPCPTSTIQGLTRAQVNERRNKKTRSSRSGGNELAGT